MEAHGANSMRVIAREARVIAALRGGLGWKSANEAACFGDSEPTAKDLLLAERMMGPIAFGENAFGENAIGKAKQPFKFRAL